MLKNATVNLGTEPTSQLPVAKTDIREQTFNHGLIGPIGSISTAIEQVCQIRRFYIDVDLKLIATSAKTLQQFYDVPVKTWLDRHPVLTKAEVRNSGCGLHILLNLKSPILLHQTRQVMRWNAVCKVIQSVLPSDPMQPGINALTRPIGSINGKNGAEVTLLREGSPITEAEIMSFFFEIKQAPLKTVLTILFGSDKVMPCPICKDEGSFLEADVGFKGHCYGKCRKPNIELLFQSLFRKGGGE